MGESLLSGVVNITGLSQTRPSPLIWIPAKLLVQASFTFMY